MGGSDRRINACRSQGKQATLAHAQTDDLAAARGAMRYEETCLQSAVKVLKMADQAALHCVPDAVGGNRLEQFWQFWQQA